MIKEIILFVLGLVIGIILMCSYYVCISSIGNIDINKTYGVPELIYYVSQPIGVLGTFGAIIVAVFGTEIKNLFFSPKCTTNISGDGFEEDLGDSGSTSSPSAQKYKCTLLLKNTGRKELTDLSLVLKEVSYVDKNGKSKKISRSENILFWQTPEAIKINLRETEEREFIIARIFPEASEGTPDNSNKSPLRFSITGVNLEKKYNKKGEWHIKYSLQTPQKIIKTFEIRLTWSGMWCNRINEMRNEVTSELKEFKS